jgi:hypothetical protein
MINHRQVVVSNFDAETLWRNDDLCKLPFIPDATSIKITLSLDEILFLLCRVDDVLITNKAFNQTFLQYLNSLGIFFQCNITDVPSDELDGKADIFKNLLKLSKLPDFSLPMTLEKGKLNTFALTDYSKQWCENWGIQNDYPDLDVIKTVNSKLYSYHLRNKLKIDIGSKVVESSNDLLIVGNEMLSDGSMVIVKDMFGVSGKGNILIHSVSMLKSVAKYIQKQENQEKKVQFLLEPLLEKELDFTCIAYIEPDGSHRIIDIQCMFANGFAYSGTCQLTPELKDRISNSNYIDIVSEVCSALYNSGYYGDVCIDSMMLKNKEIVPIVEINARKSMTYIKYNLDQFLSRHGLIGRFTYVPFNSPQGFTVEKLLNILSEQKLLFTLEGRAGVMPLSANTLNLMTNQVEVESSAKTKNKGRLYYAIVAEDMEAIEKISEVATTLMKEYK